MTYNFDNGVLYNGDTIKVMDNLIKKGTSVDVVLTSPPYNTQRNLDDRSYDLYQDGIDNKDYVNWTVRVFKRYDKLLKKDGVVLYNLSYGSENPTVLFTTVSSIMHRTPFMVADVIVWKKKSAMPLNMAHNKLTRIWEFIFVICRKDEYKTFNTNREISSYRKDNGQKVYKVVYNFIEAKNNDGATPLNKATYSTELCDKLLDEYLLAGGTVLDNFSGTGTTLVSVSKRKDCRFIGIELSQKQCEYTVERMLKDGGKKEISRDNAEGITDGIFSITSE